MVVNCLFYPESHYQEVLQTSNGSPEIYGPCIYSTAILAVKMNLWFDKDDDDD